MSRTRIVSEQEINSLMQAAQQAQDASLEDSNDVEIDALRSALEVALGLLGLELPDPKDDE